MDLQEISVTRDELKNLNIDIKERTLIIGFNEPKFKKSKKNLKIGDIDSKLNARMITYFLPAVEIARMQKNRPRYFVMSALNSALKWNAKNDEQKKIMIANNAIKIDFMRTFFDKFFPNDFSLIEYVIPQDILKVPEQTFVDLWNLMESSYFDELKEVKFQLTKFLYPKKFNVKSYDDLTEKQLIKLNEVDTSIAS